MKAEASKEEAVVPLNPPPQRTRRPAKSPSHWRRWAVILLVLLAAGFGLSRAMKRKPITVETVAVEKGAVRDEISSSTAGEVMPLREATVRAELGGRILAVNHRRGDRVKRGEVIVALDAADLDAKLKQAAATLESQHAQVAQAEVRAQAAKRTAERSQRLAEQGVETSQAAQDAADNGREAEAALQAARAQLDQMGAALESARVARSHAQLTAPFDGMLADELFDPGDELQVGAVVFQEIDDSRLHVEVTVDEADIGKVAVGQPAALRLDALPNHPVDGVVSKLDPTVRKDEKGARTLRIEVEVSNLAGALKAGLRPGMSANADVRVAEKQGVLSLPSNAVVGRGTKRTVYVVEGGVARERPVQIGLTNWERSEILSGLSEGEKVIATLNATGLADGVPVSAGGAARP